MPRLPRLSLRLPFRKALVRFTASAAPSRAVWISARARNALRRPVFVGSVSIVVFVAALVGLILAPQEARRRASAIAPRVEERVDTASAIERFNLARDHLAAAQAALAQSRSTGRELQGMAVDTVSPATAARRDSLTDALGVLGELMDRAENAPLPTSYRALAGAPQLANDPRVAALVDSLGAVERERDAFGTAGGGVDPIFVTLTSRVNEIGRAIQAIGDEKRSALRTQLAALMPRPLVPTPTQLALADTMPRIAAVDSARRDFAVAEAQLARTRAAARNYDERAAQAQELLRFSTPPLAILGAALVLGVVLGFGSALTDELRSPRLADLRESERVTGLRVLGFITRLGPPPERMRREADRRGPPYLDPHADGYQLTYMAVAAESPGPLVLTLTGDDPRVTAVVAANLAIISADEARHTLLIDTDVTSGAVAGAVRVRGAPGVVELIDGQTSWPDAMVTTTVGRSTTIQVVPSGTGEPLPDVPEVAGALAQELPRLMRYHDTIFVVASAEQAMKGLSASFPVPDVVVCVRLGYTRIRELRAMMEALRGSGANPVGLVVWATDPPMLATPQELTGRRPQRTSEFAAARS